MAPPALYFQCSFSLGAVFGLMIVSPALKLVRPLFSRKVAKTLPLATLAWVSDL